MGRGRKPKPKNEKVGYYFDEDEEQAVTDYILSSSSFEKNHIFETKLKPALTIMIESIMCRYFKDNFPKEDQPLFKEVFDDTLSHLIDKMIRFTPNKGNGFSYLQMIVKNCLILRVRETGKRLVKNIPYDDVSADLHEDLNLSYDMTNNHNSNLAEIITETALQIDEYISETDNNKLNNNEIKVGKALVYIMNNWDDLFQDLGSNKFNKSAILLYIKEVTNLPTKDIRSSMKKFKGIYTQTKYSIL